MVVQRCCVLGGVRCGRKGREQVVGVRRRSVQNSIDQSRRQLMNVLHPRAHQFVLVVVVVAVVVAVIVVVLVVVVAAVLAAVLLRYCVQKVILWLQHKRVPCIVRSDVVLLLFLLLARFFFHHHRRRAMCVAAVVGVNDVGVDKVVQVHQQQGVFVLF